MRTAHIIKQSEKCLQILEAVKAADARQQNNLRDAAQFKELAWKHMIDWHTERAARMDAIKKRLWRYYLSENDKLQAMISKEWGRLAAADIWEQTKTEVEP